MTFNIEAIYIAIIAWVYAEKLTDPGMIFCKPFVWMNDHLPAWLFKPLIGCVYCVAGQMALWYYLFYYWAEYSVIQHIFFVSLTIFTVLIIDKVLTYIKHE